VTSTLINEMPKNTPVHSR